MRRIAFALLCAIGLASLGFFTTTPATAGDYGYYGGGYYGHRYYGGGYYGHRSYGVGYYHRPYYGGGYYRRYHNRQVWYSSNCCYRRVVRHTRAVRYVPAHGGYSYYGHPYYHSYYNGYYGRPYYRYGYYGHPYYNRSYSDYVYRPYRHYYLGYDSVGYASYAGCGRVPLADGRGGWVWSRRAGCF